MLTSGLHKPCAVKGAAQQHGGCTDGRIRRHGNAQERRRELREEAEAERKLAMDPDAARAAFDDDPAVRAAARAADLAFELSEQDRIVVPARAAEGGDEGDALASMAAALRGDAVGDGDQLWHNTIEPMGPAPAPGSGVEAPKPKDEREQRIEAGLAAAEMAAALRDCGQAEPAAGASAADDLRAPAPNGAAAAESQDATSERAGSDTTHRMGTNTTSEPPADDATSSRPLEGTQRSDGASSTSGSHHGNSSATQPSDLHEDPSVVVSKALRDAWHDEFGDDEGDGDDSASEAGTSGAQGDASDAVRKQRAKRLHVKRSEIILKLASASPETIEGLVQQHERDIDEGLLRMLHGRVEAAEEHNEVCL